MARRTVRVKVSFEMIVDDDREGVPWVVHRDAIGFILNGFKTVPGLVEIKPGAKFEAGLDRASSVELRRRDRVRRANQAR